MNITKIIAEELNVKDSQVEATIKLIDDGNTIPFIARYRKELTGSLDDQILHTLSERLDYLRKLEARKEEIIAAIAAQEKLTPELEAAIREAKTLVEAEDLYRPYKQKRKTKASVAKARGLEPLALLLMEQRLDTVPETEAAAFVDAEKEVPDTEAALQGALDIITETVSDDADVRKRLRNVLSLRGSIVTKAADPDEAVIEDWLNEIEKG